MMPIHMFVSQLVADYQLPACILTWLHVQVKRFVVYWSNISCTNRPSTTKTREVVSATNLMFKEM